MFVTNNESDFKALCEQQDLHPGLVVVPQLPCSAQAQALRDVLTHIETRSNAEACAPRSFMLNPVVEIDDDGAIDDFPLP